MNLTEQDVERLARLARLNLQDSLRARVLDDLNGVFTLVQQLQDVDTTGVEPMAHPLSVISEVALALREDAVTEPATEQRRASLMRNAPAQQEGLFLVPKVLD